MLPASKAKALAATPRPSSVSVASSAGTNRPVNSNCHFGMPLALMVAFTLPCASVIL
ncbi:Uncharacterised protein [Mycobacterium tuberculosis]|nr:Uncharacterised protein [Mycobacterium tuberculosis]